MYRISSLTGAENRVLGSQRVRLLRIYLIATTSLYVYGVVFTIFPVRTDIAYGDPVGGIIAILLGLSALAYLAVDPDRLLPATVAAIAATPIVMAFHVTLTAEYMSLIPIMFLAMYIRAFHPSRHAWVLIGCLTVASLVALFLSPAPHLGVITFLIFAVAIVGAAESFGVLMRAMITAACTDPLTGLFNRAGWDIGTAEMIARTKKIDEPVAVVVLDVDGLKQINDTFGHQAGDDLLVDYATRWRQLVPRHAVLARLGGDEFAACMVGERQDVVDEFVRDVSRHTPGVSLGVAVRDVHEARIAEMHAAADAALYERRGRPLRDG